MKTSTNSLPSSSQKQLKQLFESYCLYVGNDLLLIIQTSNLRYFIGKLEKNNKNMIPAINQSKQEQRMNNDNNENNKKQFKILYGKYIILSTLIILLFTMLGLFQSKIVLIFSLIWGYLFTQQTFSQSSPQINQLTSTKSHKNKQSQQQKLQILLFWLILTIITAFQNILSILLFFLPFYHSLKLFFVIALLYPEINLKNKIFKKYFQPRIIVLGESLKQKNGDINNKKENKKQ